MSHAPGAGSIAWHVDQQSRALPLCLRWLEQRVYDASIVLYFVQDSNPWRRDWVANMLQSCLERVTRETDKTDRDWKWTELITTSRNKRDWRKRSTEITDRQRQTDRLIDRNWEWTWHHKNRRNIKRERNTMTTNGREREREREREKERQIDRQTDRQTDR